MYKVKITDKAMKTLQKMDRQIARMILAWIEKNLEGTMIPGLKRRDFQTTGRGCGGIAWAIIGFWPILTIMSLSSYWWSWDIERTYITESIQLERFSACLLEAFFVFL